MELAFLRPPDRHSSAPRRAAAPPRPFKISSNYSSKFVMLLSRERHSRRPVPVPIAEGSLVQTAAVNFICSHCGSFYEAVRVEASPDNVDPRIWCATCAAPLPAREAQFGLKYFLLRKADRGWHRTPVGYPSAGALSDWPCQDRAAS
jgi:hypothetical protein